MLDAETRYYDQLLNEHLNGCGYSVSADHEKLFKALHNFLLDYEKDSRFLDFSLWYWIDVICEYCPEEMIDRFCDLENTKQNAPLYMAEVMLEKAKRDLYKYFDRLYDVYYIDDITPEMWEYAIKEY